MYLVSWMKYPNFNVELTLILRLVCLYYQKAFESRKIRYISEGPDENKLKLRISKEIDRGDKIDIEKRKE